MITNSMTLTAIFGLATAVKAGSAPLMIQATPIGLDGQPSGAIVKLSSSDPTIASVTTAEQLGNSPAGVVGNAPGVVTITAAAQDGSGITATLVVTVV